MASATSRLLKLATMLDLCTQETSTAMDSWTFSSSIIAKVESIFSCKRQAQAQKMLSMSRGQTKSLSTGDLKKNESWWHTMFLLCLCTTLTPMEEQTLCMQETRQILSLWNNLLTEVSKKQGRIEYVT